MPETTPQTRQKFSVEQNTLGIKDLDTKESKSDIFKIEAAANLLRKSLNKSCGVNSSWLLSTIRDILDEPVPDLEMHSFVFEDSADAANWNAKVIRENEGDYEATVKTMSNSALTPGSEFRSVDTLEKLLKHRDDWSEIKTILKDGCWYPLEQYLDDTSRKEDIDAMIVRGNHQSTASVESQKIIKKNIGKEVVRSYLVPIPIPFIQEIKGAQIIPIGLARQFTVDEDGNPKVKHRVTQDLSFTPPSGYSVNTAQRDELLSECCYGQCLRRVIHMIVALRLKFPGKTIFIIKYDFDAAYRRLHCHPQHAVKCIILFGNLAYILSRLPFGAAAGPSLYSTISEAVFELCNDILQENTWDPDGLHSEYYFDKLYPPEKLSDDIEFGEAMPLAVDFPIRERYCDGYIDDSIGVCVDHDNNVKKCQQALPLAIDTFMRPRTDNETVFREDHIQPTKLKGEGTPTERRVVLGWLLCTRELRIYLPITKAIYWTQNIKELLTPDKLVRAKELEQLIGKLNHIGFILPHSRYFLNRIRHLFYLAKKFGPQKIKERVHKDLILWQKFLEQSSQVGTNLNLITYSKWSTKICTDACEHGLGGWNTSNGICWRIPLPNWMIGKFHINFLEFLAAWIGIWIELLNCPKSYMRILCLTDSSSALGWLYKSNFCPDSQKYNDIVARKLATTMMEKEAALYSQHIKGSSNTIADSLSRDQHLSSKKLIFALNAIYESQVQTDLTMLQQVPSEITCFLASLKDGETKNLGSQVARTPSRLGALLGLDDSWRNVVSKIRSLTDSTSKESLSSCPLLRQALEEIKMGKQNWTNYSAAPLEVPFLAYARPSGRTYGGIRS